jgi:hypothetical protein
MRIDRRPISPQVGEYELHPSDKKCKDCSIEARPVHKGKTKTKDSKKDTKPPPAEQVAYYLFETRSIPSFSSRLSSLLLENPLPLAPDQSQTVS